MAAVIASAGWVACAGVVIGSDRWDPLYYTGWWILLAYSFALGLISERWRILLVSLALIALAPLNRASEPALFYILALPVLIVACAALIATGCGLRKLAVRRRSEAVGRRLMVGGAAIAGVALVLTGWGIYLDQRVVDRTPSSPLLVDVRTAAFSGLRPGAPLRRAVRDLGTGVKGSPSRAPSPIGIAAHDVSGPSSMPSWETRRYRDLVVFSSRDRVRGYLTTAADAQTADGVGIGDSLAIARRAYSNLDCFGVTLGSDAVEPSYLACQGRLPSGDEIWFGGDPIDSIWVLQDAPNNPVRGPRLRPRR